MGSAKRERHRERRALGRAAKAEAEAEKAAQAAAKRSRPTTPRRPCERCGQGCRTDKPLYGRVCGDCEYELDPYLQIQSWFAREDAVQVYLDAKRRGELPPPGPRGSGVNVRKSMPPGLMP